MSKRVPVSERTREEAADAQVAAHKRRRRNAPLPAGASAALPVVAVVGRPNVGKSTLFNRLARQRIAIVEDIPGVTRDRHYAEASLQGRNIVLVDTGGFDPDSDDPMKEGITSHVKLALQEADLVVCVLDAMSGPHPADASAIALLRQTERPVIFVANKSDSPRQSQEAMALYELGIDHLLTISALHGGGMVDLEEAILGKLPEPGEGAHETWSDDVPRVAIIGRPNAGKSSLVNRLLGEERQLVDARPGTTIDAIDALLERGEDREPWVLIDTAGMRRKRGVGKDVEGLAVMKAIRSIERSHAVVLMVDAHEGVAEQDAKLAGLAVDRGRALVIGLNKADLLDDDTRKKAITRTKEILAFAPWAPVVALSAKTGRAVKKLMTVVEGALAEHQRRVTTSELNRFFEEVLEHHPPPTHKGKAPRLYFVTQAQTRPPHFVIMVNEPEAIHWSYGRYVGNALRERFGFGGAPIKLSWRKRLRRTTKGGPLS